MKKVIYIAALSCVCLLLSACGKTAGKEIEAERERKTKEIRIEDDTGEETVIEAEAETGTEAEAEVKTELESEIKTPAYIPEELLTFLGELKKKEDKEIIEIIKPMQKSQVLEEKELEAFLVYPPVAECAEKMEEAAGGIFIKADGDNDGIEDLFAWINEGGSLGSNGRIFLKGQEDGGFIKTDAWEDITQELSFIAFEGKNYLLETTYDYNKKCVDGFRISCFRDGVCCEAANVYLSNSQYETDIDLADDSYEELADKVAEMGKEELEKDYTYDWLLEIGNGEVRIKPPAYLEEPGCYDYYCSDLNNDGKEEYYTKEIFYPSSLNASMHLINQMYLNKDTDYVNLLTYYDLTYEGEPLAFWVEHVEETDRRILCLLCYDGLSRNIVYGFLIEGETVLEVMEIDFQGNEKVEYRIEIPENHEGN